MNTATRREFTILIGCMAMGGLGSSVFGRRLQTAPAVEPRFEVTNLPGGAYAIGNLNDGGKVVVLPTEAGPIIIDAKFAETAADLMDSVKTVVQVPPTLLINTHHHGDHSGGNWIFKPAATIVAHKNFNPRIETNMTRYHRGAIQVMQQARGDEVTEAQVKTLTELAERISATTEDDFTAGKTYEDTLTVEHGGVTVTLMHFGNAHTDNDTIVLLPKQNIVHMGDLVFNDLHPFIDRGAGATTKGWQEVLRKALPLTDEKTTVVPGHGAIADRTAIARQIEYFDELREVVSVAIAKGKTREEIIDMTPAVFANRGFERLQSHALGVMHDEEQGIPPTRS